MTHQEGPTKRLARVGRATLLALLGLGTWSIATSCTSDKVTQFVAGVSTQVQVPRDLRAVRVVVQNAGEIVFCKVYNVSNGIVNLPQTLGVLSTRDPSLPVAITMTGFMKTEDDADPPPELADCTLASTVGSGSARVVRKTVQPYVEGRTLYLPMPLRYSCWDLDCTDPNVPGGGPESTCEGGQCVDPNVDPTTLLTYSDDLVFGNTNTCFSITRCLPDAVPATLVDAATCTYALAGSPSAPTSEGPPIPGYETHGTGLNVRVWYEGGLVSEVLDQDAREGYVVPDPAKPQQFRLADGLCNPRGPHRIVTVAGSGLCDSKTKFQPLCSDEAGPSDDTTGIGGDVTAKLPGGVCRSLSLTPAPSVLYVLMDRSRSMGAFFGDEGFQAVLGLSLGDPVFEQTTVGMRFVPASAADCNSGSYDDLAQLAFPFTIAKGSNEAIATLIHDTVPLSGAGTVGDPSVFLDAALADGDGAYEAIEKQLAQTGQSLGELNRAAVAILGNRDFSAGCAAGQDPVAAAAAARAKGFYTYTFVLPLPNDATLIPGHDPLAAAKAIAAAGGTTAFDATNYENDPTVAAEALNTIVSDLSSCFYDLPAAQSAPKDGAVLSYFDPVLLRSVEVTHTTDCAGASGWALEGARVRICGQACQDLRDVLTTRALLAEAAGDTPADVPVVLHDPCSGN
jgi:hypothetical protein